MDNNNSKDAGTQRLNIHTFNVRGLRDKNKRHKIFTYIKQNLKGITYLQETHATERDKDIWKREWNGDIFMSNGSAQSRGVAILIDKHVEYSIIRGLDWYLLW